MNLLSVLVQSVLVPIVAVVGLILLGSIAIIFLINLYENRPKAFFICAFTMLTGCMLVLLFCFNRIEIPSNTIEQNQGIQNQETQNNAQIVKGENGNKYLITYDENGDIVVTEIE